MTVEWRPRLYLIGGPPRSGKSRVTRLLTQQHGVPFVSTDMLIHAFRAHGLIRAGDYDGHRRLHVDVLVAVAQSAIWTLDPPSYAIEGDDMFPDDLARLGELAPTSACFLGNESITTDQLASTGGWMAMESSEAVEAWSARIRRCSVALHQRCAELGVPLPDLCRQAAARTAADRCDPQALAADLPDLAVLLAQRHFGLATGVVGVDVAPILQDWRSRLLAGCPSTWGAALGTTVSQLRQLIGDNHLHAAGEDDQLLHALDPRADEPRAERSPGPVIEETVVAGVLCLRIRQFGGFSPDGTDLALRWQHEHVRHFGYERIVVDSRSVRY